MRRNTILLLAIFAMISSLIFPSQATQAVTASDWKAGRIIDDTVFTNPDEMSVADIQNFLNSRVPVCDTNGTQPASEFGRPDLTHAQFAALNGWPAPPYVCLRDYYEVPKTAPGDYIPANNFSGSIPPGAVSAAQLIYNAAKSNNINPKAILVKIATESAGPLTSDTWPLESQYTYAMGANCPDSGPNGSANCDRNYAGLSIQLSQGAGLLRWYLDNMEQSWWTYKKPYQTNSILWNVVERGCGAGDVYIESKATAALYTYTPYQPNQAALNNMYGLGDNCSAYGNRNFWRVWNDWFGSPLAPNFAAQPVWQQVYTDNTKSTALGWDANLITGQSAYGVIVMKNTGNATWTRSGSFGSTDTRLATYGPWGRSSSFCDGSWVISCTRPAALKEASVAPGEYGTFEFGIKAPDSPGNYTEAFAPIVDGRTVFSSGGAAFKINVSPAKFSAQPVWQQVYTDNTKSTALGWNASLFTRQDAWLEVVVKNTGNMTWTRSGAFTKTDTRLATYGPWGRSSSFCDGSWVINCTRPATLKESSVAPGEYGTFEFGIKAPDSPGDYTESFAPIIDGRTVFNGGGTAFKLTVRNPVFAAQPVWQQVYTDNTKSTALGWDASLSVNQSAHVEVVMKNTGNITWTKSGAFTKTDTRLATYGPWGRSSSFCDGSWVINCTRPATLKESSVAPGEYGTFEFGIKAPATSGIYTEAFAPIIDGRTVFSSGGMGIGFTVNQ